MSEPTELQKACEVCGGEVYKSRNQVPLCVKHYRVLAWIKDSKHRGVTVPNWFQMEKIIPADMKCPVCRKTMTWTRIEGTSHIITIQHDRDGAIGILCFTCNIRHRGHSGDNFYEHCGSVKKCPRCKTVRPFEEFSEHPTTLDGRRGYCKSCQKIKNNEYNQSRQ